MKQLQILLLTLGLLSLAGCETTQPASVVPVMGNPEYYMQQWDNDPVIVSNSSNPGVIAAKLKYAELLKVNNSLEAQIKELKVK